MAQEPNNHEEQLKKGSAAPLEGMLGPEVARMLNMVFSVVTLGMIGNILQAVPGMRMENNAPAGQTVQSPGSVMKSTITGGMQPQALKAPTLRAPKSPNGLS